MRQRFEQQMNLRTVAIADVKFPLKSRDELPPVLKALQYIFVTPELNEKVFSLLEKKIVGDKKNTGRPGMDLWHILVLAVARHTLSTNWDRLEHLANYDQLLIPFQRFLNAISWVSQSLQTLRFKVFLNQVPG